MNINKSAAIQVSGWSLIVAGIAFTMLFIVWYIVENYPLIHASPALEPAVMVIALIFGPFLLAFGLFGMRARYGDAAGNGSKTILLVGAILGLLMSLFGSLTINTYEDGFIWIFYGLSVQMAALALFGLLGIRSKPLPRWNGLPILAGIGLPVFLLIDSLLASQSGVEIYMVIGMGIQFLSMVVLGFILQGDAQAHEMATAAA